MTPRTRLSCALTLLALLVAGAARADDRPDAPDTEVECHPPVVNTIDGDWRAEALRFQKESLRSLARYLDGDEGARRQWRAALQWAAVTRVGAVEVVQLTRELILRGLRGKDLDQVRAAALDVRAALGSELTDRFVRVSAGVLGRATLTPDDVHELEPVVPAAFVREALGKRLGVRPDQAEARLRDGVAAGPGMAAVLDALGRQLGGAQPGDVARAALTTCVTTMTKSCKRHEAEAHCQSTPRAFLDLLRSEKAQ